MEENKPKNKGGAPARYKEWITQEGLDKIREWASMGLINKQIAHNMGIAEGTLYEYQAKFPEIYEALKSGKADIDLQVENALLKRALGYEYEEETYEPDESGEQLGLTKRIVKHQAPDTTAQIFWLKNRKPEEWRDRKQHEVIAEVNNNHALEGLTTEELKAAIDKL